MSKSMNLKTHYLGLELANPLIASASPRNAQLAHLQQLEQAGIAAVVLPSLFQEQIEAQDAHQEQIYTQFNSPEAQTYLPTLSDGPYGLGPEAYLNLIREAKATLSVPVIASLNGYDNQGWSEYAKQIELAGADALELNIYAIPTDITRSSQEIEQNYLDLVKTVRTKVKLPIAIKMSPYFTSVGFTASQFIQAGANGLVVFNRFMQPDIDAQLLQLNTHLSLSTSEEMHLPLHWVALLANRVEASIAASGGVQTGNDLVKYLLAGADTVMSTSAILRHGPEHVERLLDELRGWLKAHKQTSLAVMRAQMSWQKLKNKDAYERNQYIRMVGSYK